MFLLLLLPPVLLLCVFTAVFLFSPSVCVCCLCEGVCNSGTVKSDVWDAEGGIVPYLSASPAPAVWSRRPRLLLPPLSSRLLPLSLCGGLCCRPSFPPFLPPAFPSMSVLAAVGCCLFLLMHIKECITFPTQTHYTTQYVRFVHPNFTVSDLTTCGPIWFT